LGEIRILPHYHIIQ